MFEVVIMEASVDFAQEFGRRLQVNLCGTNIHVSHIRGQRGEAGVDILAIPVPCQKPMDRERGKKCSMLSANASPIRMPVLYSTPSSVL
jgi:hypothetical protein